MFIAESIPAVEEGIRLLLSTCRGGVIGFDSEFTKNNSEERKQIALIQLAVIPPFTPRHIPPVTTHLDTPSSPPRHDPAAAATAQPGPVEFADTMCRHPDVQGCASFAATSVTETKASTRRTAGSYGARRPACRGEPLILLVRVSKMGFRLPQALIRVLLDPGQAFATVNFKSGDGPALKRMLHQQSDKRAELLELDMRLPHEFDLDCMTKAGVDRWGAALFRTEWKKQKPGRKASWVVSLLSNSIQERLCVVSLAIHGDRFLCVCV